MRISDKCYHSFRGLRGGEAVSDVIELAPRRQQGPHDPALVNAQVRHTAYLRSDPQDVWAVASRIDLDHLWHPEKAISREKVPGGWLSRGGGRLAALQVLTAETVPQPLTLRLQHEVSFFVFGRLVSTFDAAEIRTVVVHGPGTLFSVLVEFGPGSMLLAILRRVVLFTMSSVAGKALLRRAFNDLEAVARSDGAAPARAAAPLAVQVSGRVGKRSSWSVSAHRTTSRSALFCTAPSVGGPSATPIA